MFRRSLPPMDRRTVRAAGRARPTRLGVEPLEDRSVPATTAADIGVLEFGVNSPPVADYQMRTVNEDTALNGTVTATDPDSGSVVFLLVAGPAHGTMWLNGTGAFSYTPSANYHGPDTFTFKANDGQLDSNVATVTIAVNPVNDVPLAASDSATTDEDAAVTINVLSNDNDGDGDALSPTLVTGPKFGTVVLNSDGTFGYTPNTNFNGTDNFTYHVSDGSLESNVATVAITVRPVNDAPVAVPDVYSTDEGTPLVVEGPGLLANDSDVDGDALSARLVTGPAHGTVTLNAGGSLTYIPGAIYNGTDSFSYRVSDGSLNSTVATVTVTVVPVNIAPMATDDTYSTTAGVSLTVSAPGVLANDSDGNSDPLTAQLVSGPAHGALTLNTDGSFTYSPNAGYSGTDSFSYRTSDGSLDDVGNVTIQVSLAPATSGKISGGGIDLGERQFSISAQSRQVAGALVFSGAISFVDQVRGIHLESTSLTYLRVESDGVRASIRGSATVNGVSGYAFTVFVEDHGEPGRRDKFRIVITGPAGYTYDSADFAIRDGLLDTGNMQINQR